MKNDPDTLAADLSAELSATIQHEASKVSLTTSNTCHVVPAALLSVLATTIALNFSRKGHAELIARSAERLTDLVDEAYKLGQNMTAAERAAVNPLHPCTCNADSEMSDSEMSDDEIDAAMSEAVAYALGLDPAKVKAVKLDSKEAAAVRKSDDLSNLTDEMSSQIDRLMARVRDMKDDRKTKH